MELLTIIHQETNIYFKFLIINYYSKLARCCNETSKMHKIAVKWTKIKRTILLKIENSCIFVRRKQHTDYLLWLSDTGTEKNTMNTTQLIMI